MQPKWTKTEVIRRVRDSDKITYSVNYSSLQGPKTHRHGIRLALREAGVLALPL